MISNRHDKQNFPTFVSGDYILKIDGKYSRVKNEKDHKLHFFLNGFTLETELRGNFTYDIHSPLHSDKKKCKLNLLLLRER